MKSQEHNQWLSWVLSHSECPSRKPDRAQTADAPDDQ